MPGYLFILLLLFSLTILNFGTVLYGVKGGSVTELYVFLRTNRTRLVLQCILHFAGGVTEKLLWRKNSLKVILDSSRRYPEQSGSHTLVGLGEFILVKGLYI